MATSQSARKGTWSSKTARSEPQKDWELFALAADIPKDVKGAIFLPTEKTRSKRVESEVEGFKQQDKTVGAPSSQQQMPRRRGRLRKDKETMDARVLEEPRAKSVVEELLMRAIWLEPAGGSSREDGSRYHRGE